MTCKQVDTRHTHTPTLQRKCLRIKSVPILDALGVATIIDIFLSLTLILFIEKNLDTRRD